jgi:hypothetical protein
MPLSGGVRVAILRDAALRYAPQDEAVGSNGQGKRLTEYIHKL